MIKAILNAIFKNTYAEMSTKDSFRFSLVAWKFSLLITDTDKDGNPELDITWNKKQVFKGEVQIKG